MIDVQSRGKSTAVSHAREPGQHNSIQNCLCSARRVILHGWALLMTKLCVFLPQCTANPAVPIGSSLICRSGEDNSGACGSKALRVQAPGDQRQ